MTDIVDRATRSRMMSGIRGRDTRPEIMVRSMLHRKGFRFRLNVRELPGKPDIVLPCHHAVIFVHGCFWHGHKCPFFKMPKTNKNFWQEKINRNRVNDRITKAALLKAGWRVGMVWECAIRSTKKDRGKIAICLGDWLRSQKSVIEVKG